MCDMTPSYVWHDSCICVTWRFVPYATCLLYTYDTTTSYMWHDSSTYIPWVFLLCNMTSFPYMQRHYPALLQSRVTHLNYSYLWHGFSICVINHSSVCIPWLLHMYDITHACTCNHACLTQRATSSPLKHVYWWHDALICATRHVLVHDTHPSPKASMHVTHTPTPDSFVCGRVMTPPHALHGSKPPHMPNWAGTTCCTLIATHCNTLQHTTAHYNALKQIVTHCNTLPQIATHRNRLQQIATHGNALQHTATQWAGTTCRTRSHPLMTTRDLFIRMTWLIYTWIVTPQGRLVARGHACLEQLITHSYLWHDSFMYM